MNTKELKQELQQFIELNILNLNYLEMIVERFYQIATIQDYIKIKLQKYNNRSDLVVLDANYLICKPSAYNEGCQIYHYAFEIDFKGSRFTLILGLDFNNEFNFNDAVIIYLLSDLEKVDKVKFIQNSLSSEMVDNLLIVARL